MKWILIFCFYFYNFIASAQPLGKVSAIEIRGNERTQESVFLKEIDFKVGDELTEELIHRSRIRLQNILLFSAVEITQEPLSTQNVKVIITVKERWTLLPIAKFRGAGGGREFTLGLLELNFLGRFYEVGAQYDNINGRSGGVTWFRNPRAFGQRITIGYDLWFTSRNRELYGNNETIEGSFTFDKTRLRLFASKEVHFNFEYGFGLVFDRHQVSNEGLSAEMILNNQSKGFSLPPSSEQIILEAKLRLGRISTDVYLDDGQEARLTYLFTPRGLLGSTFTWNLLTAEFRWFKTLARQHNVGLRFASGMTDSTVSYNQFFLGGNDSVRGLLDGQVLDRSYLLINAEYRLNSITSSWLILQHAFFIDLLNTGSGFEDNFSNTPIASIGTGIRFISPRVSRLNIRFDLGRTFGRIEGTNLSFGLQQFF